MSLQGSTGSESSGSSVLPPQICFLGQRDYAEVLEAMRVWTADRQPDTRDELWLVEHPPVFTLGQAGKREHLLCDIGVPLLAVDRGGQITYHGPGQVVIYTLIDLPRRHLKVRELVWLLEEAVVQFLARFDVRGERRAGAPGVYVGGKKIAALGLRVRHGCSYHGLSFNFAMDLSPFSAINPCGYAGLEVIDAQSLGVADQLTFIQAGQILAQAVVTQLARQ